MRVLREFTKQLRDGTFTSLGVPLLEAWGRNGEVQITADIRTADYIDVRNSLVMTIYRFEPRDSSWRLVVSATWSGGQRNDPQEGINPMPFVATNLDHLSGKTVRMEIRTSRGMEVGSTLRQLDPLEIT